MNEDLVISGSGDNLIKIWDKRSEKEEHSLKDHKSGILSLDMDLDNYRIISGSNDATINIWDTRRLTSPLRKLIAHSLGVFALKSDYFSIISGSADKSVKVIIFSHFFFY
jgi:WD40 repeat protein